MAKAKKATSSSTKTSRSRKTSRAKSASAAKRTTAAQGAQASESADKAKDVTIDRRTAKDRRGKNPDRRKKSEPVAVERRTLQRRTKVNRRRQIDPTTCERDYTNEEIEFMSALDEYKRTSGRMFPTCSEVLEVIRGLGYVKRSEIEAETPPSPSTDAEMPAQSPEEQAAASVIAIPAPVLDGQPSL